jgi:prolyl 4-hydroxylase
MFNSQLAHAIALSEAGRTAEAMLIVNTLASRSDPSALTMLAQAKWRGDAAPRNLVEARALFERAGEAGNAASAAHFTNLLASGIAGPRDWNRALKRLKDEAKRSETRRKVFELVRKMALTPEGDPTSVPAAKVLSEQPDIRFFSRLFSPAECDYLRQAAEPFFEPSMVKTNDGRAVRDQMRTSDGASIPWLDEDPAIHALNRRIAAMSGSRTENGEALQILRYRRGEEYRPHFDFVHASENQRHMTALVWLNDDYEGGETRFLRIGLDIKGRKGDAIVFANAKPDRVRDDFAEHCGMPVKHGTKYLASRWIRESRWTP